MVTYVIIQVKVTEDEISDYLTRLSRSRIPPYMSADVNLTYGYPSSAVDDLRQNMLKFDMKSWAKKVRFNIHAVAN